MKHSKVNQFRWRIALSLLALTLVLSYGIMHLASTGTATHAASPHSSTIYFKGSSYRFAQSGSKPPTDAYCRAHFGTPCYSPQELQRAYGLNALLGQGIDGKGQTIIIVDSYGSPTIANDLHTFDMGYGLPDPPSLKEYAPLGKKPYNPNDATMVNWAFETTLDVEWAHAMAPGARIALMTSPVAETQGIQGMPQFLFLEQYALDHQIGKVISQSWATTENTLFTPGGIQVIKSFNDFYQQAAIDGVTVFGSTGDSGVSNPNVKGKPYPFATVNFPASSPYITAVGGTSLTATTKGQYQSEKGWPGSGGGVSQAFSEPEYQTENLSKANQKILKGYRGIPDISYNADPSTSILIYASFISGQAGYYGIGGTSEGSPQWAGLIADGNQLAGHPLGAINNSLYEIANSSKYATSYHDVTVGNNGANGLPGYNCTPGWDPVTGWGSPQASTLLTEIVQMQSLHTR